MLRGVEGSIGRITSEGRAQLLPALTILHQRLEHGQWQDFLTAHRLNPSTVRSWRARERAATRSLLHLLGEEVEPRKKKREMPESAARQLAKAGKRFAQAVLAGDLKYARRLARSYLEAF